MFFDHYPYTNFHNVNLDWVLQAVKAWGQTVEANDRAFQDLKEANEDFKAYVTNYLQDLDITDEINTKLDAMLASGVLTPYFAPYVKGYVDSWLASHVTPTSPALDSTLTLSGAAARADSTGKRLKDLAYIDALSTPEIIAALNRSQVLPGYRVQGIAYDYNGHYYVCGGSVDETGTGVIVKMTKPDFTDAEITEIPQLGHANDITYYDGYLYVCTVGGGDAPRWGIYKINVNDFTDKTLISNAPENTIGISYRQGDFWILAPYRIYRTTDFTSYEVVVANTNDLLTAYGIPTSGRISQTLFRAAGYLIGWVCSFVFEDRHYGALTFFNSAGEAIAFKMFPAYHTEIQGAVYADMSIYLLADGNMVNVFRMDPRHLSYVQLKAGDDLNSFTGRGTLYSTGSNVSAELLNSPSSGEGFTVQVDRLGVYNTIQTARTNSGRELYRVKSFSDGTWGEWIEPAAEVAQITDGLSAKIDSIDQTISKNEIVNSSENLAETTANNVFSLSNTPYGGSLIYSERTGENVGGVLRHDGTVIYPRAANGNLPSANAPRRFINSVMRSYVGNDALVYGNEHTLFSSDCTNEIDCSSFVTALMYGIFYNNSKYVTNNNVIRYNNGENMYIHDTEYTRLLSYQLAEYYADRKRFFAMPIEPYQAFNVLEYGDLLFTPNSGLESHRYYNIAHVMMVVGKIPDGRYIIVAQAGGGQEAYKVRDFYNTVAKISVFTISKESIENCFVAFARPNYSAMYSSHVPDEINGDDFQLGNFWRNGLHSFASTWSGTEHLVPVIKGSKVRINSKSDRNPALSIQEYTDQMVYIKTTNVPSSVPTDFQLSDTTSYITINYGFASSSGLSPTLSDLSMINIAINQ